MGTFKCACIFLHESAFDSTPPEVIQECGMHSAMRNNLGLAEQAVRERDEEIARLRELLLDWLEAYECGTEHRDCMKIWIALDSPMIKELRAALERTGEKE